MWQFGWMLSLIPDSILIWITYLIITLGVGLYVASKLVKWIPMMGQYKFPSELAGFILFGLGCYMFGGYGTDMVWRAKVKAMEEKIAAAEAKSQQVNTVIQTKVVERVKVVEKKVVEVRNIIERDKEAINAECKVSDIAVQDYNKAVADPTEGEKK